MTTFTPPIEDGVAWGKNDSSSDRLFRYYGSVPTGATVWRDQADVYHTSQYPYQGRADSPGLAQAKEVYLGGHIHDVTAQQAADLTAAGYGNRINIAPVEGTWTTEQLAKFSTKMLLTDVPGCATKPPFVSANNAWTAQLLTGVAPGSNNLREFFLHSDTSGWTDTHAIVEIDPPLYAGTVDGIGGFDILPQMGIVLRAQFNPVTGKNQGVTMNNGTIFGLPVLNIGAWHAFPDGTGFNNRQFGWPLFESLPLPYGWEVYLQGNIVRVRIFAMGDAPNTTPWDHPTHARTLNLDVDCGSVATVPSPVGIGTNGIITAHLGTDPRSACRIRRFSMEKLA